MDFSELVQSTRSIRNFDETKPLDKDTVRSIVSLCRYTPATANKQPLKFAYTVDETTCREIFPHLRLAGYLTEKPPYDGHVPTGYVLICYDTSIMSDAEVDCGICAQTMVLGAREQGIGACMIGSFDREKIAEIFQLDAHLTPRLILALGYPAEEVEIIDIQNGDVRYFRDGKQKNIVPKRTLDELIITK